MAALCCALIGTGQHGNADEPTHTRQTAWRQMPQTSSPASQVQLATACQFLTVTSKTAGLALARNHVTAQSGERSCAAGSADAAPGPRITGVPRRSKHRCRSSPSVRMAASTRTTEHKRPGGREGARAAALQKRARLNRRHARMFAHPGIVHLRPISFKNIGRVLPRSKLHVLKILAPHSTGAERWRQRSSQPAAGVGRHASGLAKRELLYMSPPLRSPHPLPPFLPLEAPRKLFQLADPSDGLFEPLSGRSCSAQLCAKAVPSRMRTCAAWEGPAGSLTLRRAWVLGWPCPAETASPTLPFFTHRRRPLARSTVADVRSHLTSISLRTARRPPAAAALAAEPECAEPAEVSSASSAARGDGAQARGGGAAPEAIASQQHVVVNFYHLANISDPEQVPVTALARLRSQRQVPESCSSRDGRQADRRGSICGAHAGACIDRIRRASVCSAQLGKVCFIRVCHSGIWYDASFRDIGRRSGRTEQR